MVMHHGRANQIYLRHCINPIKDKDRYSQALRIRLLPRHTRPGIVTSIAFLAPY